MASFQCVAFFFNAYIMCGGVSMVSEKVKKGLKIAAGVVGAGVVGAALSGAFNKRAKIPYKSSGGVTRYLGKRRKQKRK